jgi:uncharacterized protein (TIGR02217 family)
MAFHDVSLPPEFQYGSSMGAGFATIVQQTASGHEYRVARQSQGVHRMGLRSELRTSQEAQTLKAFALARRGALHSFRCKDWSDYSSASNGQSAPTALDVILGTGNGTVTTYQLVKRYEVSGPNEYTRTITLPVSGTVVAALNGVTTTSFTVNSAGQIEFGTPPGVGVIITAGFQFDVPVRFTLDVDRWARLQADAFGVWSLPSLDVQEVLAEVEWPERWQNGGSKALGTISSSYRLAFNDGALITFQPSGAGLSLFLPVPTYQASGPHVFTLLHTGGGASITLRDDAGATVTTITSGTTIRVGLVRASTTYSWVTY